jgi:hypothetical protein
LRKFRVALSGLSAMLIISNCHIKIGNKRSQSGDATGLCTLLWHKKRIRATIL